VLLAPAGAYVDAFTGAHVDGESIPLSELLARYPVALLLPAGARNAADAAGGAG